GARAPDAEHDGREVGALAGERGDAVAGADAVAAQQTRDRAGPLPEGAVVDVVHVARVVDEPDGDTRGVVAIAREVRDRRVRARVFVGEGGGTAVCIHDGHPIIERYERIDIRT